MPSSSLLIGSLAVASIVAPAVARVPGKRSSSESYTLVQTWEGSDFFDYFDFYTGADPTDGFVDYLDKASAESAGLVNITSSGSVYLGVDYTTTLTSSSAGRSSVRLDGTQYFDHGLFIADIQHMPGSICGVWPAFWTTGETWPTDGEIDIIEGVNLMDYNEVVAHTGNTCIMNSTDMTGTLTNADCSETSSTTGCVVEGATGSYGTSFNDGNGGVYAMQWTDDFIKIWFFARDSIPTSITDGTPDVSAFGTPLANLQGSCDIAEQFQAQRFVFDTTFCGDWAGGVFLETTCPISDSSSGTASCVDYVAANPSAFEEAYWEINSIKIYQ
ncbi:hypothetical protein ASPZODRAFT_65123, partial [Penicilliopsis zonata CBS 506.65]